MPLAGLGPQLLIQVKVNENPFSQRKLPADHTSVYCQLKSRFEVDRHAFCRAMHG
jgi:hypothetical protein